MTQRIVIVGGDAAGMSAAHQALRAARVAGREITVTVLEATGHTSYSACGIPYWIAGDVDSGDALVARTAEEHRAAGIDLLLRTRATAIDLEQRTVSFEGATSGVLEYDDLVLATGATPIVPDWATTTTGQPGLVVGVHPVKNLDDGAVWDTLLAATAQRVTGRRPDAVVVGAGYIGIEMAEALLRRGFATTVVTRAGVMGSLDADMGERIAKGLVDAGVRVLTGTTVEGLEQAEGRVAAVVTGDGERLPADVVVLAIGVEPATALGRAAGLPIGEVGGYLPDAGGRVAPGVWAAGDCCEVEHRMTGDRALIALGTHANKLGRIVGDNLLGADERFGGALGTAITRFVADGVNLEISRTGLSSEAAAAAGFDVASLVTEATTASGYMPEATPVAVKVIADRPTRRLLGVQIVGGEAAAKRIDAAAVALWGSMTVDDLAWMDLSYAPPFATVWDALQISARRLAERL